MSKHWSPVIIIRRQPVFDVGQTLREIFFFIHEKGKQAVRSAEWIEMQAALVWFRSRQRRAHTNTHICCYFEFSPRLLDFRVDPTSSLTSWWASPPQALPAVRPRTEAWWWSCTCSTAALRQSSTWEHKQPSLETPTLIPPPSPLCAQANDPESLSNKFISYSAQSWGAVLAEHWSVDSLWLQTPKCEIEWQMSKQNSPWLLSFPPGIIPHTHKHTRAQTHTLVQRQTHLPLFD